MGTSNFTWARARVCLDVRIATPLVQGQWRSQDEQVMSSQHGHTQFARNTQMLGDFEIAYEAGFSHKYPSSDLPVCSLHVCMKLTIITPLTFGKIIKHIHGIELPTETTSKMIHASSWGEPERAILI